MKEESWFTGLNACMMNGYTLVVWGGDECVVGYWASGMTDGSK